MSTDDNKNELQEWLTQSTKIQDVVLKAVEDFSSQIKESQKIWEEALQPIVAQVEKFQSFFQESLGPFLQQVAKAFKELPPQTQRAVLTLASHGWFFDLDMTPSELWRLSADFSKNEVARAEDELANYFDSHVNEIKNDVTQRFPNRKACLDEAFLAHLKGCYYLSIPVFLAQTDGICKEAVGHHLFIKSRKDKKPSTAIYVAQLADDSLHTAFMAALAFPLPIGASEHERGDDFDQLNRHMVLHGESTDYGTKINSLKAISLLSYVAKNLPSRYS